MLVSIGLSSERGCRLETQRQRMLNPFAAAVETVPGLYRVVRRAKRNWPPTSKDGASWGLALRRAGKNGRRRWHPGLPRTRRQDPANREPRWDLTRRRDAGARARSQRQTPVKNRTGSNPGCDGVRDSLDRGSMPSEVQL